MGTHEVAAIAITAINIVNVSEVLLILVMIFKLLDLQSGFMEYSLYSFQQNYKIQPQRPIIDVG